MYACSAEVHLTQSEPSERGLEIEIEIDNNILFFDTGFIPHPGFRSWVVGFGEAQPVTGPETLAVFAQVVKEDGFLYDFTVEIDAWRENQDLDIILKFPLVFELIKVTETGYEATGFRCKPRLSWKNTGLAWTRRVGKTQLQVKKGEVYTIAFNPPKNFPLDVLVLRCMGSIDFQPQL